MPQDYTGRTIARRYTLDRVIADSGMSTVYEGTEIQSKRKVAVKLLDTVERQHVSLARFMQEAALLNQLSHPRLVHVLGEGVEDKVAYIAMEYLSGESLDVALTRWAERPPDIDRFLAIFLQICEGLEYIHQCGVIHRDIKPSNVFLEQTDGTRISVKLVDFGIAKRTEVEPGGLSPTHPSQGIPGTPEFMSPEQIHGDPLDARSDIYSLGVLMYRALTGHLPFHSPRSPYETLMKHVSQPPPSFEQLDLGFRIPDKLEQIVMRALAKSPDARFASAREVRESLVAVRDQPSAVTELNILPMRPGNASARPTWTPSRPSRVPLPDYEGATIPSLPRHPRGASAFAPAMTVGASVPVRVIDTPTPAANVGASPPMAAAGVRLVREGTIWSQPVSTLTPPSPVSPPSRVTPHVTTPRAIEDVGPPVFLGGQVLVARDFDSPDHIVFRLPTVAAPSPARLALAVLMAATPLYYLVNFHTILINLNTVFSILVALAVLLLVRR